MTWTFKTRWPGRNDDAASWTVSSAKFPTVEDAAAAAGEWLGACAVNGELVAVQLVKMTPD